MIEAAITLPMFALLLCGTADISRTLYLNQVATAAARAGVHRALQGDPQAVDLAAVEEGSARDAGLAGFTAKATKVCACGTEGDIGSCEVLRCSGARSLYVRVETSIEIKPFMRYPGLPSPYVVRGHALLRLE